MSHIRPGEMTHGIKSASKTVSLILALIIFLSACASGTNEAAQTTLDNAETTENTDETEFNEVPETDAETTAENTYPDAASEEKQADDLEYPVEYLNSLSMLNYLTIKAEEICLSKNNRLILQDIYSELINNLNPSAIDIETQNYLTTLRSDISKFVYINEKRDRLQYLYNQDKAKAFKSLLPDPVSILSITSSADDKKKLAIAAALTVIDSLGNYIELNNSINTSYLIKGWDLNDEEVRIINDSKESTFNYMTNIVRKYQLDGLITLSQKSVEKYIEICSLESPSEKINRLISEEKTYHLVGDYWLELADCYFETNQYEKCLECIDIYSKLAIGIYRCDYNLVKVLPKAIISAQNIYSGDEYVRTASQFTDQIIDNTHPDKYDWSFRYFAAQIYIDLYDRTNDIQFLKKAYRIAKENVNNLLNEQRQINEIYTNDLVESKIEKPNYNGLSVSQKESREKIYNEELKSINDYNKLLKKARKTELPALYEPLILNCELLLALTEKYDLDDEKIKALDNAGASLSTLTNGIFLQKPINDRYSFSDTDNSYRITFNRDSIIIPVSLLTSASVIKVTVDENGQKETFDDCIVTKVDRKGADIDSFEAVVSSKTLKKHKWTPDSKITVDISYPDAFDTSLSFSFYVSKYEKHWYGTKIEFSQK